MKSKYNRTIYACFTGYIVQAIINNFVPLLFLTFQSSYQISLSKITLLVTINFGTQLIVDLLSISFVDKIGYRASIVIAHVMAAAGLALMTILPELLSEPFHGLVVAVVVYAIGGGLLEVLVSPIVEACPTDNKEKAMSLLHSFYCWGHVGVVLLSTIFFRTVGINHWKILALIWAVVPAVNTLMFLRVPIAPVISEGETGLRIGQLIRNRSFWVLVLLMLCAGACEQSVSQWASTLAEQGLGVSKTIGDLAGPMLFAIMMGGARTIYGKFGERIDLSRFMIFSTLLCMASYLVISLSGIPLVGLIGCGLCGLSVGIMWPGTFSTAAMSIRNGGTAMYAILALAGDVGCSGGPTYVGLISGAFGDNLKIGIFAAIVFPVLMLLGIGMNRRIRKKVQVEASE